MGVEDRLDDLERRVEALEEHDHDAPVRPGQTARVVITDPADDDRDAFARIEGMATFVKAPDDHDLAFGDSVRVRIADVNDKAIVAVATDLN